MSSLNASVERMALVGLILQYPHESEGQHRRRLYERRYGKALADQVYAKRGSDDARA